MKFCALLLVPAALLAAEDKKPAAAAKPSGPVTIPADAELVGPRTYRAKDASGKVWLYRQTPFGVSRVEESVLGAPAPAGLPKTAAPEVNRPAEITATDLGDSVRFEQATPMGKRAWTTKKSELSQKEKAVLEHSSKSEK